MSSYQYKCTGIPVEQFQGQDGETAGDRMHAWGVGVGPQREVDPATLPTEERGPARTSDGVVWVDVCDGELRAIPTTIGARIDNDRGTENGTGGSPVSMRCQFADECDRRWATVERERRRADIAPDHGNSQARVLGFDSVESEPDWNAGGDRDFPASGQDGFGTHPDDSDVWEKAETRSDGSKADAQARGTSRCTWPVAGVRVRDDEVSWEDSGSVDCDSQDQNSYSDEEESYDQNGGYRYRDGDATAASPAPTSAPPAASAPQRGGRRDMVPSVGARDAKCEVPTAWHVALWGSGGSGPPDPCLCSSVVSDVGRYFGMRVTWVDRRLSEVSETVECVGFGAVRGLCSDCRRSRVALVLWPAALCATMDGNEQNLQIRNTTTSHPPHRAHIGAAVWPEYDTTLMGPGTADGLFASTSFAPYGELASLMSVVPSQGMQAVPIMCQVPLHAVQGAAPSAQTVQQHQTVAYGLAYGAADAARREISTRGSWQLAGGQSSSLCQANTLGHNTFDNYMYASAGPGPAVAESADDSGSWATAGKSPASSALSAQQLAVSQLAVGSTGAS